MKYECGNFGCQVDGGRRACPVMGFTADGYERISSMDEPVVMANTNDIPQPTGH